SHEWGGSIGAPAQHLFDLRQFAARGVCTIENLCGLSVQRIRDSTCFQSAGKPQPGKVCALWTCSAGAIDSGLNVDANNTDRAR
ncbi:hypothetical protein, partial [Pseudomonas sp. NBRC 111140]|uniref:hypothetical protein n=1 Tax=Pseudomonas sp. NBRC 111140 TaxID=1661055 RepID=UPI001C4893BD